MLAEIKMICTFAALLEESTSEKEFWRGGRVVDCGGLENRCTERYPGFESLSLRKKNKVEKKFQIYLRFLFYLFSCKDACGSIRDGRIDLILLAKTSFRKQCRLKG